MSADGEPGPGPDHAAAAGGASAGSHDRLRVLHPGELTGAQRDLYGAITGGPRAKGPRVVPITDEDGGLRGPFNAMLYVPELGQLLQQIGSFIRYQGSLPPRMREIAIMVVAARENSAYEWTMHAHQARMLGLSDSDLLVLARASAGSLADPAEQFLADAVWDIADGGDVPDPAFARLCSLIGEAAVFELTVLVGYYRALALILRLLGSGDSRGVPPMHQ